MTSRFIDPIPQYTNDAGEPLAGGKLYFYESGTTTFRDTYVDAGLVTPNANPVILDSAGRPPSIFLQGNYKLVITDANDVQISSRDPVSGTSASGEYSDWSISTTYALNNTVRGSNGYYYISITNNNLGNDPTSSAANWSKTVGITEWNTNQTYSINDTSRYNGLLYRSTANSNLGSQPDTLVDWVSLAPASAADSVITISSPDTRISSDGVGDVYQRANGVDVTRADADGNFYVTNDLIIDESGTPVNVGTTLSGKADISGTYAGLRAQATTKDDVGLGDVPNYTISDSYTLNSSIRFASSKAVHDLNLTKANTSGTYAGLRAQATTKDDVGLGNVGNYGITSVTSSGSTTTYASAAGVKAAHDRALSAEADAAAAQATADSKANTSGTYASLRAQATTKDDVGLGSVNNYGASSSVGSNSTSTYATTALTNDLYGWLPYQAAYNGVGQIALLQSTSTSTNFTAGSTYSASGLNYSGFNNTDTGSFCYGGINSNNTVSGTWRALGTVLGRADRYSCTLFVRIS
jgi:hypothetical protein